MNRMKSMRTRRATLPDARQIHELIAAVCGDGSVLPRPLAEICENIREFTVLENCHRVVGCGALHLYGPHLSEIRSIAVAPGQQRRGRGSAVVRALLAEVKKHRVGCVWLFTLKPEFFARLGFRIAERESLPEKIYKDRAEVAMVRGSLPNISMLPQRAELLRENRSE